MHFTHLDHMSLNGIGVTSRRGLFRQMAGAAATLSVLGACAPTDPVPPGTRSSSSAAKPRWKQLPSLPDTEGFAGMYAGVSGGALLAAGGAKFPDKRPWEGGTKVWYDTVYALDPEAKAWVTAGRLPRPAGYGVSATWRDGMICAGGGNARQHFDDVLWLKWDRQRLTVDRLPAMPGPRAFCTGTIVETTLYIVGGTDRPDATECVKTSWALDLANPAAGWRELEPFPGPARMLAVSGAAGGAFYLFSGARLSPGPDGKPVRDHLRDTWRYVPGKGWQRLANLPRAALAAPSPAPVTADGKLLILSGDDGTHVGFKPEPEHPGFPRTALAYLPAADAWSTLDTTLPISRATAPTTIWKGNVVIPSGEVRPGYRSPEVWELRDL